MRIHPSLLGPGSGRGPAVLAAAALLALAGAAAAGVPTGGLFGGRLGCDGSASGRTTVLVAAAEIGAGEPLSRAALVSEERPSDTVPPDYLGTFDFVGGKVAAGPIPARAVVTASLLADPVPEAAGPGDDTVAAALDEAAARSAAFPVRLAGERPPKGSRVVLVGREDGAEGTDASGSVLVDGATVYAEEGENTIVLVPPSGAAAARLRTEGRTVSWVYAPGVGTEGPGTNRPGTRKAGVSRPGAGGSGG